MGWLEFCGQVAKREIADEDAASDIRQLPSSPDCPETAERLQDDCIGGRFASPRPRSCALPF